MILIAAAIALAGIGRKDKAAPAKELLIYCGTTMHNAVKELAIRFETENNCVIKIVAGGPGIFTGV